MVASSSGLAFSTVDLAECGTPLDTVIVAGGGDMAGATADQHLLAQVNRLAAGARRHASRFSWDRTVDSLVAAYTAAMAEMAAGTGQLRPARERLARDAVRLLPGGTAAR